MGNFWADKLGHNVRQQTTPPTSVTAHSTSANPWWDTTPPPAEPVPEPGAEIPAGYKPHQATSTEQDTICPQCRGVNYLTPPGLPNVAPRCTNCGYSPVRPTSGGNVPTLRGADAGPVQPARQVHGGDSNYHPEIIIAEIK